MKKRTPQIAAFGCLAAAVFALQAHGHPASKKVNHCLISLAGFLPVQVQVGTLLEVHLPKHSHPKVGEGLEMVSLEEGKETSIVIARTLHQTDTYLRARGIQAQPIQIRWKLETGLVPDEEVVQIGQFDGYEVHDIQPQGRPITVHEGDFIDLHFVQKAFQRGEEFRGIQLMRLDAKGEPLLQNFGQRIVQARDSEKRVTETFLFKRVRALRPGVALVSARTFWKGSVGGIVQDLYQEIVILPRQPQPRERGSVRSN